MAGRRTRSQPIVIHAEATYLHNASHNKREERYVHDRLRAARRPVRARVPARSAIRPGAGDLRDGGGACRVRRRRLQRFAVRILRQGIDRILHRRCTGRHRCDATHHRDRATFWHRLARAGCHVRHDRGGGPCRLDCPGQRKDAERLQRAGHLHRHGRRRFIGDVCRHGCHCGLAGEDHHGIFHRRHAGDDRRSRPRHRRDRSLRHGPARARGDVHDDGHERDDRRDSPGQRNDGQRFREPGRLCRAGRRRQHRDLHADCEHRRIERERHHGVLDRWFDGRHRCDRPHDRRRRSARLARASR
jgi:hypothetical protein